MSLNPGGSNFNWNYSKADKPNYTDSITGTVVSIQEVQSRKWSPNQSGPGAPEFWDDGKPKMNIRILLLQANGQFVSFTFQPAGKDARAGKKRSVHMDLFALTGNTDMKALIGKTITIATQPGNYGQGNPRPFDVSLVEGVAYGTPVYADIQVVDPMTGGIVVKKSDLPATITMPDGSSKDIPADYKVLELLADDAAAGGQVMAQPQYAAPQVIQQPQVAQPAMTAPGAQTTMQPMAQPATQPVAQPQMTAQMPAGMDPQVAAAMQTLGATNVQPVTGEVYDEDIPF